MLFDCQLLETDCILEFDPPIASRSTDELIEIANFPENWNISAVNQAQDELTNRRISDGQQQEKVAKWNRIFQEELDTEMKERAIESYGTFHLIWMAFRWPYTILGDWSLRSEGYIKMHKERLYSIGTGVLLWISMLLWLNFGYESSQRKWQNEVNSQDIYEWEKNYYSDEEMAEFRKESIEQVIQTVRDNETSGIPTYIILDKDTFLNSQVEQLRDLAMLNIRDVITELVYEPEYHETIKIILLKPTDNDR